uniref:Uncharacterized protein n=1 Tax=Ascaris lumbricoides TaxID=6252 RepID=A0A0M3HLH5_ASCLU
MCQCDSCMNAHGNVLSCFVSWCRTFRSRCCFVVPMQLAIAVILTMSFIGKNTLLLKIQ